MHSENQWQSECLRISANAQTGKQRWEFSSGPFSLETTELDITAIRAAARIGLAATRCACPPNVENHGGYRLARIGDIAVNNSHHYTMTAQQVIDYCAEKERDDVAKFFTLVFEYHVDPGAAFEALMYAQAEGEEVEQVVRDVWHDAGISDIGGMIRAVIRHYSQEPGAAPQSRDVTFGCVP